MDPITIAIALTFMLWRSTQAGANAIAETVAAGRARSAQRVRDSYQRRSAAATGNGAKAFYAFLGAAGVALVETGKALGLAGAAINAAQKAGVEAGRKGWAEGRDRRMWAEAERMNREHDAQVALEADLEAERAAAELAEAEAAEAFDRHWADAEQMNREHDDDAARRAAAESEPQPEPAVAQPGAAPGDDWDYEPAAPPADTQPAWARGGDEAPEWYDGARGDADSSAGTAERPAPAELPPGQPAVECKDCDLVGDPVGSTAEANTLAGVHDDTHHGGQPTATLAHIPNDRPDASPDGGTIPVNGGDPVSAVVQGGSAAAEITDYITALRVYRGWRDAAVALRNAIDRYLAEARAVGLPVEDIAAGIALQERITALLNAVAAGLARWEGVHARIAEIVSSGPVAEAGAYYDPRHSAGTSGPALAGTANGSAMPALAGR